LAFDSLSGSVVDIHGTPGQSKVFFKLTVHQVDWLCELCRTLLQSLLKQVAGTLDLCALISLEELGQEDVPQLESDRITEKGDASLVDFEAFLKVRILFEEVCIIDNHLQNMLVRAA
jgi:hypothetical protein